MTDTGPYTAGHAFGRQLREAAEAHDMNAYHDTTGRMAAYRSTCLPQYLGAFMRGINDGRDLVDQDDRS